MGGAIIAIYAVLRNPSETPPLSTCKLAASKCAPDRKDASPPAARNTWRNNDAMDAIARVQPVATRMSTALGETAQPQAATSSENVQSTRREEPRIAREGAAPERPKVHDWKSCVRATVPRVRTGVECSTQWKIPRRTTVLAQQATRVVHPSLSALERSRC